MGKKIIFSGAQWRKSSHSGSGNNCVEVASLPGVILVRDSKNPDGPVHAVGRSEWRAFLAGIRSGELGA